MQERIIERLKDQREREDRERLEEVDSYKKENKDLKEKVNSLQIELTEKEVSGNAQGRCQRAARDFALEHVLCAPLARCSCVGQPAPTLRSLHSRYANRPCCAYVRSPASST